MSLYKKLPALWMTICASAFLQVACDVESSNSEVPERILTDSLYTDNDLGFSIALPSGWRLDSGANGFNLLALDYIAVGPYSDSQMESRPSISVDHEASGTMNLQQYLAFKYDDPEPYDSVRIQIDTISGVAVGRVVIWYSYFPHVTDSVRQYTRYRDIVFIRRGSAVSIFCYPTAARFDSNAEFSFIDSSLTFF